MIEHLVWCLTIGVSLEFGIWDLELAAKQNEGWIDNRGGGGA
jgi:hypothetical protein